MIGSETNWNGASAAAGGVRLDLVDLRIGRLLVDLAAHGDSQRRAVGAGRTGGTDQQVAGNADLEAEFVALRGAFARGLRDVELVANRGVLGSADAKGCGAVLDVDARTIEIRRAQRQTDDFVRLGTYGCCPVAAATAAGSGVSDGEMMFSIELQAPQSPAAQSTMANRRFLGKALAIIDSRSGWQIGHL